MEKARASRIAGRHVEVGQAFGGGRRRRCAPGPGPPRRGRAAGWPSWRARVCPSRVPSRRMSERRAASYSWSSSTTPETAVRSVLREARRGVRVRRSQLTASTGATARDRASPPGERTRDRGRAGADSPKVSDRAAARARRAVEHCHGSWARRRRRRPDLLVTSTEPTIRRGPRARPALSIGRLLGPTRVVLGCSDIASLLNDRSTGIVPLTRWTSTPSCAARSADGGWGGPASWRHRRWPAWPGSWSRRSAATGGTHERRRSRHDAFGGSTTPARRVPPRCWRSRPSTRCRPRPDPVRPTRRRTAEVMSDADSANALRRVAAVAAAGRDDGRRRRRPNCHRASIQSIPGSVEYQSRRSSTATARPALNVEVDTLVRRRTIRAPGAPQRRLRALDTAGTSTIGSASAATSSTAASVVTSSCCTAAGTFVHGQLNGYVERRTAAAADRRTPGSPQPRPPPAATPARRVVDPRHARAQRDQLTATATPPNSAYP